jgi:hypothetical protein
MRHLAALIATAAVLVTPAAAAAKEISKVRVCGVDGCATTRDQSVIAGLTDGGPPTVPPAMRGGVISLRSTVQEGDDVVAHFTSWWVPELRMLVTEDGTWMRVPPAAEAALAKIGGGFEPFPASTIGLSAAPTPAAKQPPAAGDGGGLDWWPIALGAAALAAVAALLVRRRPRGDFPVPAP